MCDSHESSTGLSIFPVYNIYMCVWSICNKRQEATSVFYKWYLAVNVNISIAIENTTNNNQLNTNDIMLF